MNGGDLLAMFVDRPGWRRDALCLEHPQLSWFPTPGQSIEEQVAICQRCAVIDECREYALDQGVEHGIWGATSGRDRRRLQRARRARATDQTEPTEHTGGPEPMQAPSSLPMLVVGLDAHDPVLGMCTATSSTPHRHQYCQLPFGHAELDHDWADEYRQPCSACGTVLVTAPRLECASCDSPSVGGKQR